MDFISGLALSIIAALLPALIYAWFVYWLDRHEKEPWRLLGLAFLWGMIPAVLLALIAQLILDVPTAIILPGDTLAYTLVGASVWAPITEEIAKGVGVFWVVWLAYRRRTHDGALDGLVYGALVGLGFGFTEDILYIWGTLLEGTLNDALMVAFLRTIVFGLSHTMFTGAFGLGLGYALVSRQRWKKVLAPSIGLAAGMLLHSLHNVGASLAEVSCFSLLVTLFTNWGGFIVMAVLVGLIWREEKRWIATQLKQELLPETYHLMTTWRQWQRLRWQALFKADFRTWRTLGAIRRASVELAFKKQQLAHYGPNPQTEADIAQYRTQLANYGVTSIST